MTKKIVFVVALALVIVGIAAPSASAACNPPKFAATYNALTGGYVYWHTSIVGGTLHGEMWSGSTSFTGTCNSGASFLYFGVDPQNVGLSVSLGDACVPGCPSGSLSVKATVTDPGGASEEFIAVGQPETPAGGVNFDFSGANGAYPTTMVRPHRPRVSASNRGPTNTVSLFADAAAGYTGGAEGNVSQCIIRSATTPKTAVDAPGAAVANWPDVVSTLTAAGGTCPAASDLVIDCSNTANDRWIAVQYVDTVGGPGAFVGDPTRIKCDPALAQPTKPKPNPKKPGIGNIRNN